MKSYAFFKINLDKELERYAKSGKYLGTVTCTEDNIDNLYNSQLEAKTPFPDKTTFTYKEWVTKVVFRKFRDGNKEVIAILFSVPDVNFGKFMSYMHVGQHGECDSLLVNDTDLAKPDEYADLQRELEGLGYNLKVYQKIPRNANEIWTKKFNVNA